MKDRHITELLDETGAGGLSPDHRAEVESHVSNCQECMSAWSAYGISSSLLRNRASFAVEPPSFFTTRVMAAVRERRSGNESLSLGGIWRAARGLVTAMAAIVLVLGGLSLASNFTLVSTTPTAQVTEPSPFSAERVLFADGYQAASYEPTNGQVYQAVLGPEDSDADF